MIAPLCKNCGKPLRKHTHSSKVPRSAGETKEAILAYLNAHPEARKPWADGKAYEVIRFKPYLFDKAGTWDVSWWAGCWGGYGDNRFCGITCGWRWAVNNSTPARRPEVQET